MPMPVINEIVRNHSGPDTREFIEIFGDPNTDYSNYVVLEVEGDGSSSSLGQVVNVFSLGSTDANGFFVTDFLENSIQNGTNTFLLVRDYTGGADTVLDEDQNGELDATLPFSEIVDSVALSDGGASDLTYSSVVIEPGFDGDTFDAGGVSRAVDGVDTDSVSDWVRNDFSGQGLGAGFPTNSAEDGEAVNTPGSANLIVGAGGGDPQPTETVDAAIYTIQGAGHMSTLVGQSVATTGIVTAVGSDGFYLQDAVGDGDIATSDAIFVSTDTAPSVSVGDALSVTGIVEEAGFSNRLTVTELNADTITVTSTGNALPSAVLIGEGGRTAPTEVVFTPASDAQIDLGNASDAAADDFDPGVDGIDFWESLEGMLVTLADATATAPVTRFGEVWALPNGGAGATGLHGRGGLAIDEGDFNPERIQIDLDGTISPDVDLSGVTTGASLGDVTGVISYNFGDFELIPTAINAPVNNPQTAEITTLESGQDQLTVASYNVLNLDPSDTDQIAALAAQITTNLAGPDILALQEIQDNNGTDGAGVVASDETLQALIDAISVAGGPAYSFAVVDPVGENTQGGAPDGNIRVAYLYRADRVELDNVQALTTETLAGAGVALSDVFEGSRIPLEVTFSFNGESISLINVHFTARGGSDDLFGANQLPSVGGDSRRADQAAALNDYVDSILGSDAAANVVVLGDFNDFEFSGALDLLEGGSGTDQILTNLTFDIARSDDRYTFIFEGNGQALDHVFVSDSLFGETLFDIVHVNTDFLNGASDHEPILARINLGGGRQRGDDADNFIFGGRGADTVAGVGGNDFLIGDSRRADSVDDRDLIFGGSGDDIILTGGWNDLNGDGAYDTGEAVMLGSAANIAFAGLGSDRVIGTGGSEILGGGAGNDTVDAGAGADTIFGGSDVDSITGGDGADVIFGGTGDDSIAAGTGDDTVWAGLGADAVDLGDGADTIFGGGQNDTIMGGGGADLIFSGGGDDVVDGGAGDDELWAGGGDDLFTLGAGADRFVAGANVGNDRITDFDAAMDILDLQFAGTGWQSAADIVATDVVPTGEGAAVLEIDLGDGETLRLDGLSTSDLENITIVFG